MLMELGYQGKLMERSMSGACDRRAHNLFRAARAEAAIKGALAKVGRRSRELPILAQTGTRGSHAGLKTVAMANIRGSEDRRGDFDIDFLPLNDRTSARWHSIARARLEGRALPVVNLLKIGDAYYVRDGHHRISVARLLGETAIEAEVTLAA